MSFGDGPPQPLHKHLLIIADYRGARGRRQVEHRITNRMNTIPMGIPPIVPVAAGLVKAKEFQGNGRPLGASGAHSVLFMFILFLIPSAGGESFIPACPAGMKGSPPGAQDREQNEHDPHGNPSDRSCGCRPSKS